MKTSSLRIPLALIDGWMLLISTTGGFDIRLHITQHHSYCMARTSRKNGEMKQNQMSRGWYCLLRKYLYQGKNKRRERMGLIRRGDLRI
jgi:hypothetical protein